MFELDELPYTLWLHHWYEEAKIDELGIIRNITPMAVKVEEGDTPYLRADLLPSVEDLQLLCRIVALHQGQIDSVLRASRIPTMGDSLGDYHDRIDRLHMELCQLTEQRKRL